jgi:hypothetical protein
MHVLTYAGSSRARSALVGGLFAALSLLAGPALSEAVAPPAAVASKLLGGNLSKLWADPASRSPVIVQFKSPEVAAAGTFGSPAEADAARTRAVHAAQDAILGAAFGTSVLSGPAGADLAIKRMDFSPMFGISVTAAELEALASNPQVVRIQDDERSRPQLDDAVPLIGMPNAYAQGATGTGQVVAVLDSGTRITHEFVNNLVISAACFSTTATSTTPGNAFTAESYCPGGAQSSTALDSANDCDPATIAGCGHGTHVSGIAAGNNGNRQAGEPANGVARDGRLITINVFSKFTDAASCGNAPPCILSFTSDQIKGLEHVFALRNTLDTFAIAAVNMSLGGGQESSACDADSRKPIIDLLKGAGIATLIAAGNDGFDGAVSRPGCISTAITVASSTKTDERSNFSNWSNLVDIVAPGSSILSSDVNAGSNTFYSTKSGTSMATPMAAGAFAAIRTARPGASVDQIESALKSTGLAITAAGVTKPRIRVDQALSATPGAVIVAAVTPVARVTVPNGTVTAFATILNVGQQTATSCSIASASGIGVNFSYSARNVTTGAPENPNVPVDIPAGGRRDFLMTFTPTFNIATTIPLEFTCTNTLPAPSIFGLNRFTIAATLTQQADLISIAATPTNDGIMNVPLGGTGFAALAAVNIGATASIRAEVTPNPITVVGQTLPATITMCQTNPATGACITPLSSIINFTSTANSTVTFSAFVTSDGTAIPFDPANTRLFVNFTQDGLPAGSASVAVRTTAAPSPGLTASAD